MNAEAILRSTLASVLVELERLDPKNLVAARAHGVLDATGSAPSAPKRKSGPVKGRITDRHRQMAALYQTGLTLAEVGERMGATSQTVRSAVIRLGVPVRPKGTRQLPGRVTKANEERIQRIREGRAQGLTLEEIGAKEGITRERVRQLCVKAGIDTPRPELTPEELAAVARYLAGDSIDVAAESIGRSPYTMRRILFQAGHAPRPSKKERRRQPHTIANAERAAELYAQGLNVSEIAEKVGVHNQAMIYRLLAIAGVRPTRRHRVHLNGAQPA